MNKRKSRPTIYDVAKKAQVSISTVSRVLNRNYPVSQALTLKVEKAVQELGFVSNQTARRLSGKATDTIGVVIMYPSDFLFTDYNSMATLRGIDSHSEENDTVLIIYANWNQRSLNSIRARHLVDGIILIGAQLTDRFMKEIEEVRNWEDFPVVMVNHHCLWEDLPEVAVNHQHGSYDAVTYLLKKGHRNVVYICHDKKLPSIHYSIKGFKLAYSNFNLDFHEQERIIRIKTESHYTLGELAVKKLLELSPRPTAFIAHDDTIAVTIIQALRQRGLTVPDDISCIGSGDFPIASEVRPELTTKRIDGFRRGYLAAQILLKLIRGEEVEKVRVLLPAELVERETVFEYPTTLLS